MDSQVVQNEAGPHRIGGYPVIRVGAISALPTSCKRVRYRKDDCRVCQEICPERAISLNPGPGISSACTECGLCVAACPTQVFSDERREEQELLAGAHSLPREQEGAGQLTICCTKAGDHGSDSLTVSCLGKLSAHFVVALAAMGFQRVTFARGPCGECRLKPSEALFSSTLDTARRILAATGILRFAVQISEGASRGETYRSRRGFFSPIAALLGAAGRAAAGKNTTPPRFRRSTRQISQDLLAEGWVPQDRPLPGRRDLPYGSITIDAAACSTCGICSQVCPTGAVYDTPEPGYRLFWFDPVSCLNCRLCGDACPEGALRFEEEPLLSSLLFGERRVAARVELATCAMCGDEIPAVLRSLCPTCEKRYPGETCSVRVETPAVLQHLQARS